MEKLKIFPVVKLRFTNIENQSQQTLRVRGVKILILTDFQVKNCLFFPT
jgi:hypothetical protein